MIAPISPSVSSGKLGGESQPSVQNRMAVEDSRRGPVVRVRTAVASRMRELQPDQEAVVGAGEMAMLLDQNLSQMSQAAFGMRGDHELIGIGAPVVTHGHRLPAPDQFRAALSEPPPSANRILARIAVSRAVPSFHRMDGDAVADTYSVAHQRLRQRRIGSARQFADRRVAQFRASPDVPGTAPRRASFQGAKTHWRSSTLLVRTGAVQAALP